MACVKLLEFGRLNDKQGSVNSEFGAQQCLLCLVCTVTAADTHWKRTSMPASTGPAGGAVYQLTSLVYGSCGAHPFQGV